jgi:FixJ family two-component response regulator
MRQHGAIDYVAKPIGREMLHQALERALAKLPL